MSDAPPARPSVKDLAKMNMQMPVMGGAPPGGRILTPRTSVHSGSFAALQRNQSGSALTPTVGNAPPAPTISTAGVGNAPPVAPSPRVAALAAGMNFGGFGAPRPSVSGGAPPPGIMMPGMGPPPGIIMPGMGGPPPRDNTAAIEEAQKNLGETTRRRPSVRRNSRMSRTHFDDIDIDVSNYMATLNAETPRASITPSMSSFKEEATPEKVFKAVQVDHTVDVPGTLSEEWEVVDLNKVKEDMNTEVPSSEDNGYIATFVKAVFSYAFTLVDPDAPVVVEEEKEKAQVVVEEEKKTEVVEEKKKEEPIVVEEKKEEEPIVVEEVKAEEEPIVVEEVKAEEAPVVVQEVKAEEAPVVVQEEKKEDEIKTDNIQAVVEDDLVIITNTEVPPLPADEAAIDQEEESPVNVVELSSTPVVEEATDEAPVEEKIEKEEVVVEGKIEEAKSEEVEVVAEEVAPATE